MSPVQDQSLADFTRTRWSMVCRLQGTRADAHAALTELALRYWYPVYAYVRGCGHQPEIAQDITQAFLQQAAADLHDRSGAPPGRFREWLLARLNVFLAGEWREQVGAQGLPEAPPLAGLEARRRDELGQGGSPEQAYRRSFALEVLSRGLKRLRAEARQTGHADMCEALEPFLTREPVPGQYDELGRRLSIRPLTLVMALKRLRQRFRELVRDELADTVASADELAAERQVLFAALDQRC